MDGFCRMLAIAGYATLAVLDGFCGNFGEAAAHTALLVKEVGELWPKRNPLASIPKDGSKPRERDPKDGGDGQDDSGQQDEKMIVAGL